MLYFLIRMIVSHKYKSKNNVIKDYKCQFCKARFQHFENFKLHQQLNHNDREDCCIFFRK
jgi:protein-disulfide isomerase